ncbi:hypothetical protein AB0C34_08260 [Nocardia sp. NPDC049220]|uniref:hypothetical protein n=1 Tax=Nocardia sp. NPDC049220 TaxID=3155273 RepID=UPI0034003C6B
MATRSVPQPPFTAELLADLHADNVTPEQRDQLWPMVSRDPEALRFLQSLDDVSAKVRALGRDEQITHSMPADVATRLARFVEELDRSELRTADAATIHPLPHSSAVAHDEPAISDGVPTQSIQFDVRRRRRLRRLTAAAAAIAVVACAGVVGSTLRDDDDVAPGAKPTTDNGDLNTDLTSTVALGALGRHDVSGSLARPGALDRCVQANGLDRKVLGSTDITFQDRAAVLILLAGPHPPKITALVVGTGCRADDPQRRALQDIG